MRGVPVSATRFIGWWGPQKTMKKIASLHSCVHGGQINSPLKSKIDKKKCWCAVIPRTTRPLQENRFSAPRAWQVSCGITSPGRS